MEMTRTTAPGTPRELDVRRQLDQARQDLAEAHAELRVMGLRYVELHVAYLELLTHARATAAADAREELSPGRYVAGHLEEIGLQPALDAEPDHLIAEGLAVAARLEGRQ
jgi:hypothetical protein